ncbi:ABC transporter permease [Methylocystis bryophila]|uniref:ABC transporter permease n=1 Tax=Methylocystis bryophila TaxID=655015 RepID=A0A1W6N139_9HYPH|nr:ABC transporter substrate-binding protein [Methylocystis bryophila]ARN83529.1 ABC transporter permease [Methylocystis bryophila]
MVALAAVLALFAPSGAGGGERRPLKIAMFADLSSVYSQSGGKGAIEAARMAIEDFGASAGAPVGFVFADPHNNAKNGAAIARKWYAEGVDVIADVPNSAVALAVQQVSREAKRIVLFSSPASDDLTGPSCSPYSVHWTYDTYAAAHGTAQAIINAGGDSWFFITADYAFGDAMERDASDVIRSEGGMVLGGARAPLGTMDFSRYLLQAKNSQATVVGLAVAGQDMINALRQASEFSIVQDGQRLAGLLVSIADVNSLGLQIAQGLRMTSAYYWDQNDATRRWAARFFAKTKRMPTMVQAGVYGALAHYLKAVQAVGGADAEAVMAKMRETPINDFMTHDGRLRIDGRVVRDMYLFEAKTPAESKYPWDYLKLLQTIPADEAFRPLGEGGCPLVSER